MTNPFAQLDKSFSWMVALLAGCAGIVIWDQWHKWSLGEDYTFGYLVPFFCLYVLYDRWPQIKAVLLGENPPPEPMPVPARKIWDALVTVGLYASLLLFALGALMLIVGGPSVLATWFNSFGFVGLFLGLGWLACAKDQTGRVLGFKERWTFVGLITFPALVWLISGPFIWLVDSSVRIILLSEVTTLVVQGVNMLGMEVTQSGNIINLPTTLPDGRADSVGVADACSGIRSLTACVFMGAFLSAIFVKGWVRKLSLLVIATLLALVLNVLRTGFLTIWAFKHSSAALDMDFWGNAVDSPEFTLGSVHDVAGYAAMGITFVFLIALLPLVNLRLIRSDKEMLERRKRSAPDAVSSDQ